MRNLAVIPARCGSKGLKDKNIKLLNRKPMIAYTIQAALNSECFDKIIVSTDSKAYAKIAKEYGAEVPFLRLEHLSGDEVATNCVISDLLLKLKEYGEEFDCLMILQPTSPLRTSEDIKKAITLMKEKKANAVVSLCEVDHSPLYAGQVPDDLCIDGFIKKDISYRRQKLPKYYRLNGAIYLTKVDYFMEYQNFYQENCYAYLMDKERSIDIDDEIDFVLAEIIMKKGALMRYAPQLRKNQSSRPKAFFNNKENLEVIVLGCDPSSTNQEKSFETVFDIGNPKYEGDFRKNPYFRDIMINLICIFEESLKNISGKLQPEKMYEWIYVQNLCPDYLERCTGYYKSEWSKWIKNDLSGAGYIRELKTELDNLDPDRKLPVLLTSSYLLEALVDREKIKGRNLKFRTYYKGDRDFITKEENDLERILIPFSRNRQAGYMLESQENKEYCERIKNYLRNL